ncbi:denticleless protein homolog [Plakobranchus ocellatus]|uniref:Denticleless protein homolog n=1 Tax=Plakobranchus ocellatus TaxID=259542 RepID=A0AAV4B2E0_9GAST|nr:denticleless protein homolog [Plakobranchus ocellatus]
MLQPQKTIEKKPRKKQTLPGDAQQSVTSVLFQHENFVISAGAVDGCLKVWDIRKTYQGKFRVAAPVHIFSYPGMNSRKHGL